ncbi:MAG: hypothetical protein H0W50_12075 [Parachlamydiaceae bacterium]|nr:hypothetical protein [Parachlamydiaceae bacterium]
MSFQETQKKLKEHYNLEIPSSSIQAIVEGHAKGIFEFIENDKEKLKGGNAIQLVAEVDGSMVPIVETALPKEGKQDKRRCRNLKWKEARLCFVREVNQVTPIFYATMGDVERVGQLLYRAALRVGLGARTKIHGVGDGAKWIADQMKRVFCKNVKYLIDFYHVSEYLAEAAEYGWTSEKGKWREENQNLLKQSKHEEVLQKISLRLPIDWKEKKEEDIENTPVEKCYRYLDNRRDQLDYKDAIEKGLPIGSGEIESSHRYVIQKRLKIAGAWWRSDTAEWMLNLRVLRANNDWDAYWEYLKIAA